MRTLAYELLKYPQPRHERRDVSLCVYLCVVARTIANAFTRKNSESCVCVCECCADSRARNGDNENQFDVVCTRRFICALTHITSYVVRCTPQTRENPYTTHKALHLWPRVCGACSRRLIHISHCKRAQRHGHVHYTIMDVCVGARWGCLWVCTVAMVVLTRHNKYSILYYSIHAYQHTLY